MIYILTVKKRRNWHRHDYSEHDDSGKVNIQQVLLMLLGIKPFNSWIVIIYWISYFQGYIIHLSLTGCSDRDSGFHQGTQKQDISKVWTIHVWNRWRNQNISQYIKKALLYKNSLKPSFKGQWIFKVSMKAQKTLITCLWGK